jgi:hypothetical protein
VPVHTAVWAVLSVGELAVAVAVQLFVLGSYLPPVSNTFEIFPPAPNDHFVAGPYCRVRVSSKGRIGRGGGCPTIRAGIVSATAVEIGGVFGPAPNDHFSASPHGRMKVSAIRCVGCAGGDPAVYIWIVPSTGVPIMLGPIERFPSPDDQAARP